MSSCGSRYVLALEVFAHAVIVTVVRADHGGASRVIPAVVAIACAVLLTHTMTTTCRRTDQAIPGFRRRLIFFSGRVDGPVSILLLPLQKNRPAIREVDVYPAT